MARRVRAKKSECINEEARESEIRRDRECETRKMRVRETVVVVCRVSCGANKRWKNQNFRLAPCLETPWSK